MITILIVCLIFVIILLAMIYNNTQKCKKQEKAIADYYIPTKYVQPRNWWWQPTVCDPYYQPCWNNWYYLRNYFYPI